MGNLENGDFGFPISGSCGRPVAHKEVALANGEFGLAYPAACGRPVASRTAPLENGDYGFAILGAKGKPVAIKTAMECPCGLPLPLNFWIAGGFAGVSGPRPGNLRYESWEDYDPETGAPITYYTPMEILSYAEQSNYWLNFYGSLSRGQANCKTNFGQSSIGGIAFNPDNYLEINNFGSVQNKDYDYYPVSRITSAHLRMTLNKDVVVAFMNYGRGDDLIAHWIDGTLVYSRCWEDTPYTNLLIGDDGTGDSNGYYPVVLPKNTPIEFKFQGVDNAAAWHRIGFFLYIFTQDMEARDDWYCGLKVTWENVNSYYHWTATCDAVAGWTVALDSIQHDSTATDWTPEGDAAPTCIIYSDWTQPAPPPWTPSFHHWSATYNFTDHAWTVHPLACNNEGPYSGWSPSGDSYVFCVTDSFTPPAPPNWTPEE
jgi:hypothetical protein